MESYYREIAIALIGAIASIVVARIQARATAAKKGDEAVTKATNAAQSAAKATAHDVLTNGAYKELRQRVTSQQGTIDEYQRQLTIMGKRIDDVVPVYLERDKLAADLIKAQKALAECLQQKAPKP